MKRGILEYQCNICGAECRTQMSELLRERPSCLRCGSTPRFRSIISLLSRELFGESMALDDFPQRSDLKAIGLSDWEVMAVRLSKKFSYQNTYFHQEPMVDITRIPDELVGQYDFIISSEVFEHILPPVSRAFKNSRRMLKPTGFMIFTAPYRVDPGPTNEHYPRLHEYRVIHGDRVVIENVTVTGERELYEDPIFHGGEGVTLEMRVFTEQSLRMEFQSAGFEDLRIMTGSDFDFGVFWSAPASRPMIARPMKSS